MPVVFSGLAPFMNNKILDRSFMARYPGGESATLWANRVISAGYEFMTIDHYYQTNSRRPAMLISDMATGIEKPSGLIPAFCMSLESPIVASRYYHNISNKTRLFHKVWDWAGVASKIFEKDRRFIPNSWPTTAKRIPLTTLVPWQSRRFMALVSGNKRALQWNQQPFSLSGFHGWVRSLLSNLNTIHIRTVNPWMKSELYLSRLQAIGYFSEHDDFDLYGSGWGIMNSQAEKLVSKQIEKAWRGVLTKNKIEVLPNYRFYLCYENTSFPGYITEKIFDCLFSGVIPVYLGDPEIKERIPPSSYIDAQQFSSYPELDDYLRSMIPSIANDYLDAGRQFLKSEAFYPFTADFLADIIVSTLDEINTQYQ